MTMKLQGATLGCSAQSIWECRMLAGNLSRDIKSYYPDVGRGSIEHNTVSHELVERGIARCARKTIWEKVCGWLDI